MIANTPSQQNSYEIIPFLKRFSAQVHYSASGGDDFLLNSDAPPKWPNPSVERKGVPMRVFRPAIVRLFSCAFLSILCASGCESWFQHGRKGIATLPQTSVSEANFSKTEPSMPFSKLAVGLATRTIFRASDGVGTQVEVRDLLTGPQQKTESTSLPGAAVLEIRSGAGTIQIGDKQQELSLGSTLTVPERAAFTIENKSDVPMTVRAFLFRAE